VALPLYCLLKLLLLAFVFFCIMYQKVTVIMGVGMLLQVGMDLLCVGFCAVCAVGPIKSIMSLEMTELQRN